MARSRRPARRASGGGFFSLLAGLLLFVGAAGLVGMFAFIAETNRAGPLTQDATFMVERGASAAAIGEALAEEGYIRNPLLFRVATRAYARGRSLQAGEYALPAQISLREVVERMASGDALMHAITFHEGITIDAVMNIIADNEVLTGDLPEAPPEGSVLPETYHVQRGMTREALLQQMRDAHDAAVEEIWADRQDGLPITSPEELVTLASIVERETGIGEERPLVAAVFVNRLRVPMRLESDPTIIYGVCRQYPNRCTDGRLINASGQRRTIRQSEIELDTGYNTYRIDRLPPTPIANPGRAALEATAHPAETNALYFVADGSGGHAFAASLAEHNANVGRWREIERERLAAERAD